MPRGFFGRRDGVRSGASELEGCLGIKIGHAGCSMGCVVLFGVAAIITTVVVLLLKFKFHVF